MVSSSFKAISVTIRMHLVEDLWWVNCFLFGLVLTTSDTKILRCNT